MLARQCYGKNLVFDYLCSLLFVMTFTNSLTGLMQCSATAAGVKAQLAKCKHEDMPRAPCSNALCSLRSVLATGRGGCAPATDGGAPQNWALCLPAEAPTGEQQQPPPLPEKITPFRQFKWRTSQQLLGLKTKIGIQKAICGLAQLFGLFGKYFGRGRGIGQLALFVAANPDLVATQWAWKERFPSSSSASDTILF